MSERIYKGKNLVAFTKNYTIFNIKTTGLNTSQSDIIEISAIRVRDGKAIKSFSSFVNIDYELSDFIINYTGITNDMIKNAPKLCEVLPKFLNFVGDDILVGHNANADIDFIYDNAVQLLNVPLTNDYIDTHTLSKKLHPELQHHRLNDMTKHFSINVDNSCRGLADCYAVFYVYNALRSEYENRQANIKKYTLNKKNDAILFLILGICGILPCLILKFSSLSVIIVFIAGLVCLGKAIIEISSDYIVKNKINKQTNSTTDKKSR